MVKRYELKYAPLRGTARELLISLRRGQRFEGPVARLAELINVTPTMVWRALANLAGRGLIDAYGAGYGIVRVSVTKTGRLIRV